MHPTWPLNRTYHWFLLLAIVGVLSSPARTEGPGAQEVLRTTRAFDAASTSRFTLHMEIRRYHRPSMPEHGIVNVRTVLTSDGASWGMLQESVYENDPQYRPLKRPYTEIDYDSSGNLLVWRDTAIQTFVGPDVAGRRTELTLYRIDPHSTIVSVEKGSPAILLFAPQDEPQFVNFKYLLWAMGRGFAPAIRELRATKAGDGGLLELEGPGAVSDVSGNWRISVDPDNAYLTRKASFTVDGRNEPLVVLRTRGVKWFGDLVIPEEAEISLNGDRPEAMVHVKFISISGDPDASVLETTARWVRGPYAKHTEVTDFRDRANGPVFTRIE